MAETSRRPNVVVFFTDQQRWDTCGCYGSSLGITPHLDAMARRGTRLDYSFTCQPVCGPARSSFQTGLYATRTGVWHNGLPLRREDLTLAKWFNEAGYRTGYIGKWHLGPDCKHDATGAGRLAPVTPEWRGGYQDWYAANILEFYSQPYAFRVQDGNSVDVRRGGYRVDAQTDLMLEYLRDRAREDRPFFLFTSYLEPHHQNEMQRFYGPEGSRERFKNAWAPKDLKHGEGDWEKEWADYLGCCASLDDNLGRMLSELEVLGLADHTLVLFAADHGCHFRTRNAEYKRSCHESCIRVPTVIQGPGFDGGVTVRELVSLVDWPATLLDAAGIGVPENIQGRSVLPLVQAARSGQASPVWPEEVFIQISESHIGRALRTKKWKYSVRAPRDKQDGAGGSSLYVEDFLYDLEADPNEQKNLVGKPEFTGTLERLRAKLLDRMQEAGEQRAEIQSA